MAKTAENGTTAGATEKSGFLARIDKKKLWTFVKGLKIELMFAFYAMPGYLCIVALLFLPIEKACRYNLGYTSDVCDQLNNGTLKAACGPIQVFQASPEATGNDSANALKVVLDQISLDFNFTSREVEILNDICTAETEAQKLQININQIRALLEYLGIVVIMYAGPLGDKYNRKKLFLLLPMLGELINVLAYLTTSVFQAGVPMEFHLIIERLMYSLSGSFSLMLMGIFAFLAAMTEEKDRTFRFGVFSVFNSGLGTVVQQFAAPAFLNLGYVKLFALCAVIHLIGCLFIIFCIDEIPRPEEDPAQKDGLENPAYSGSTLELQDRANPVQATVELVKETSRTGIKGFFMEIVNLFKSNFDIYKVIRPANGRLLLFLVTGAHVIILLVTGENDVAFLYGRQAWGWTTEFGDYSSYGTAISFIGTIIVTAVFVNFFKFTDSILAMVAMTCALISKPIFALTKKTAVIYTAATIDMFKSAPAIAIRSLLTKLVLPTELGRCFTVIAILEVLIHPVTSIIYNTVYTNTIESFPGAFYFVSAFFLVIGLLDFFRIGFLFKQFEKVTATEAPAETDKNQNGVMETDTQESHKL